jgi:hypothetical protein
MAQYRQAWPRHGRSTGRHGLGTYRHGLGSAASCALKKKKKLSLERPDWLNLKIQTKLIKTTSVFKIFDQLDIKKQENYYWPKNSVEKYDRINIEARTKQTGHSKLPVYKDLLGKLEAVMDLFRPSQVLIELETREFKREHRRQMNKPLLQKQ